MIILRNMSRRFEIHNVRFFDLAPRSAHCLAYSRSRNLLALSRSDNSIEIWNFGRQKDAGKCKSCPILQRIIPAHETQGSVEALAWAGTAKNTYNNLISPDDFEDEVSELGILSGVD